MNERFSYLAALQASQPDDIVYALASLTKDSWILVPDYNKSIQQVFKEVTNESIKMSRSLNIIYHPWALEFTHSPSWATQVSGLPFITDASLKYVRNCAETPPGLPNRRTYWGYGSIPTFFVF